MAAAQAGGGKSEADSVMRWRTPAAIIARSSASEAGQPQPASLPATNQEKLRGSDITTTKEDDESVREVP